MLYYRQLRERHTKEREADTMRTMYRVEKRVYTDCEGRSWDYKQSGKYVNTVEEATEYAKANAERKSNYDTGDYRIVERTIDEEAFTVVENIVAQYDWWAEIGRYEYAEEQIARYTQRIAEVEASKVRCKTEKGIARKDKEIAQYKEWIACAEAVIAEKR